MKTRCTRAVRPQSRGNSSLHRTGLAPLELVLVMPVLMMVSALMLFLANAAVWKLRSHGAAREVAFQQIHPRAGEPAVSPPEWRRGDVSVSILAGPPAWNADPFEDHPLFRGPEWQGLLIDETRLNGSQGLRIGHSQSDIPSGLWPQMKVRYRFERDVAVLTDHQWQYDAMRLPGHGSRRSLILLNLD